MNILFICSRNKWRSRTAETIFKNHNNLIVKSAGTEPSARIKINQKLLDFADIIFVMEKKHKEKIVTTFLNIDSNNIIILDIEDNYKYMDKELIEELKISVNHYLKQ